MILFQISPNGKHFFVHISYDVLSEHVLEALHPSVVLTTSLWIAFRSILLPFYPWSWRYTISSAAVFWKKKNVCLPFSSMDAFLLREPINVLYIEAFVRWLEDTFANKFMLNIVCLHLFRAVRPNTGILMNHFGRNSIFSGHVGLLPDEYFMNPINLSASSFCVQTRIKLD